MHINIAHLILEIIHLVHLIHECGGELALESLKETLHIIR